MENQSLSIKEIVLCLTTPVQRQRWFCSVIFYSARPERESIVDGLSLSELINSERERERERVSLIDCRQAN